MYVLEVGKVWEVASKGLLICLNEKQKVNANLSCLEILDRIPANIGFEELIGLTKIGESALKVREMP